MKIAGLIILLLVNFSLYSQGENLSATKGSVDSIKATLSVLIRSVDSIKITNDSLKKEFEKLQKTKLNGYDFWLVFSPLFLFVLLLFITRITLNRQGWSLKEALSSDVPTKLTRSDPADPGKTQTEEIFVNSSSRIVLFLSGITTLIITVCLVSYYIYYNIINRGKTVDYSDLTSLLIALGIGVIPYAANKCCKSSTTT